jgi:hydrogenase maturation protein HypF
VERRSIAISGVVQGVGFRPFVHALASKLGLSGFVRNDAGTVEIEVEGEPPALDGFVAALRDTPPPLSRIDAIRSRRKPLAGGDEFHIEESNAAPGVASIPPDVATCPECLSEICDPNDRRHGYAFSNCTNCGPRLTIVEGAPYDRASTTMASFEMCDDCRREYEDPRDRRFHAQPICCPRCGPSLRLLDGDGAPLDVEDPIEAVARALRSGKIAAVKGVGGYHLACNALDENATSELRRRKSRAEKPFAILVADLAAAEAIASVSAKERELLLSPARPIVLLRRKPSSIAPAVAPNDPLLGVMLPCSPLQHLLLRAVGVPLVMTSANRSDEPIAYQDETAVHRLSGIADLFLAYDRLIHTRCDDSVVRVVADEALPIRRSRGYAPLPLPLPLALRTETLAVGGQLKSVFALGAGKRAYLSHHLGDLDYFAAFESFTHSIERYRELCGIEPRALVHDLHPDYASTRWARLRSLPGLGVQHHHAHFASCLAENGVRGPAIGVTFDGSGYGSDGTVWGGEFLVGDLRRTERVAHLFQVPMPGGEKAIREPWRMAVSHLRSAGLPVEDQPALLRIMDRGVNSPLTSSMGRLFDAAASIAGLRRSVTYEGQAAIELEWAATGLREEQPYPFELNGKVIDTRPLIRELAGDTAPLPVIARRFHSTVVEMIATVCTELRRRGAPSTVALSGGVFMNAILLEESMRKLTEAGFVVLRHRHVPPNDGGLALGQLACAAALEFS